MRPSAARTGVLDPERDRDLILANRARIHAELPEAVPFIKAMVDAGMLEGWRSVSRVAKFHERPPGEAVPLSDLAQFYVRPVNEVKP